MAIIQIEVPDGTHCTGCPCSLILPYEYSKAVKKFWSYGCTLLHVMCKSGGEYDTHAIKHPKCPSLNPRLIITESTRVAGKKGSSQGGLMRAMKQTPEQRRIQAKHAAMCRWAKPSDEVLSKEERESIERGLKEAGEGKATKINMDEL